MAAAVAGDRADDAGLVTYVFMLLASLELRSGSTIVTVTGESGGHAD